MRKYAILAVILATLLVPVVAMKTMPSDIVRGNQLSAPEPLIHQFTDPAVFPIIGEPSFPGPAVYVQSFGSPSVMPSEVVRTHNISSPELLETLFTSPDVFKDPLFNNTNFLHYVPN